MTHSLKGPNSLSWKMASGNQIGRSFPWTELGHRLFKLKNRLQVHIDIASSNGKLVCTPLILWSLSSLPLKNLTNDSRLLICFTSLCTCLLYPISHHENIDNITSVLLNSHFFAALLILKE